MAESRYSSQEVGAVPEVPKTQGLSFVLKNQIDFGADSVASSTVVEAISVEEGTIVESVQVEVDTVEGGTATIDIGVTGGDTDGFGDEVNINASTDRATATSEGYHGGFYFDADDTIDIIANNDLDTAVITVRALCKKLK